MIDNFALAISHGLLTILVVRLLWRQDLDRDLPQEETAPEPEAETPKGFARRA
jgi:hypothetical protein